MKVYLTLKSLLNDVIPHLDLFLGISDELLIFIFSFLTPNELCYTARVCKKWNGLSCDNHLWKALFLRHYGNSLSKEIHHSTKDWKKRFMNRATRKVQDFTFNWWQNVMDWDTF